MYLLHLGLLGDLIQSIPIAPTWRCRMRSNTDVIRGITKINVYHFLLGTPAYLGLHPCQEVATHVYIYIYI